MLHHAPTLSIVPRFSLVSLLIVLVGCEARSIPSEVSSPVSSSTAVHTPVAPPRTTASPLNPPVDVKMGVLNIAGDAGIYIALERGYFTDEGLRVELVSFRSGQEQIPALATNQIQFGSGSLDVSLLNAVARDIHLRIVQDKGRNSSAYSGAGIVVRTDLYTDGSLDEIQELQGKTLAISVIGTTTDLYLERALAQAGLTLDDINLTIIPIVNMTSALANRAVDAAWMFEPFTAQALIADVGRILIDTSKIAPHFYSQFLLVSEQFAQQNPEAVRRFVTAHLRGQRDYYYAFVSGERTEDREAIIEYLIKYTAVKDRTLYDRMGYGAVEPNGYIDPTVLEEFQDWAFQKGRLAQKVDIHKLIDPQYVQYAVERLGRLPERFR
ncbi:MAG TPA: ABC transporter substrate-binding protein [Chloroflexota bacterium]|nr:ABC transporter substrate-binding protein [Chloroflexota bacterium]